jgi:hypothetical protein
MHTWVDASYAVHGDMKSHTGGVISFGRGAVLSKSSKQKLNTRSSTEAELVGASDYLPSTIWTKYFLDAQGYEIKDNFYHQDNQSAIKIERNGKLSGSQKTRHIDIRYFWIKDRLIKDNIEIKYCKTEAMLADFFMKPLQGNLFRRLREVVMGRKNIKTLETFTTNATSQERVGNEFCDDVKISHSRVTKKERSSENDKNTKNKKRTHKTSYADAVRGLKST